jgi:hypothetical protein
MAASAWRRLPAASEDQESLFPAAPAFRGPRDRQDAMTALMGLIREQFDYCVIDSPGVSVRGSGLPHRMPIWHLSSPHATWTACGTAARGAWLVSSASGEVASSSYRVNPKSFAGWHHHDDVIDAVGARSSALARRTKRSSSRPQRTPPHCTKQRGGPGVLKIAGALPGERVTLRQCLANRENPKHSRKKRLF